MSILNLEFSDIKQNIAGDNWWPFDTLSSSLSAFSNVIGICPGLPTFTSDVTSTAISTLKLNPILYIA